MQVLQIVPRVPPASCGIGDYAWNLAKVLRDKHGYESSFLCAGIHGVAPVNPTEFPVQRIPGLSSRGLCAGLDEMTDSARAIILHVSLYGYQRRAVPFWLAGAMRRIADRSERPNIIMMFHELYASGSITTSTFWLQPLQKMILRQLARSADILRTNREPYADWLKSVSNLRSSKMTVMPVFSNFGETATPPPLKERPLAMVMFGAGVHGGSDAAASMRKATRIAATLGLTRLHVLGAGEGPPEREGAVVILRHPHLPSADISSLLLSCRLAYNAYHPLFLGKSTVLAAYAAHGLAVIQAERDSPALLPDGLRLGEELVPVTAVRSGQSQDAVALQAAATRLHAWYAPHNLEHNASSYAQDIQAGGEKGVR